MQNGLSKVTHITSGSARGSSTNANKHPYLRKTFWEKESNQFWNSDLYSKRSKEYFNDSISRM